ncbi:TetR-like C-terminal domain-containing protein [Streptomyces sp. NPDC008163]|uniref:TetR-like C-terminal domain-containing protein n=1 Tax=Streptomyces sp. NPDC008163 TaxID=3364818 RepID=UPI0036F04A99
MPKLNTNIGMGLNGEYPQGCDRLLGPHLHEHEGDAGTAERFQSVILDGVIRPSTDLIREVVGRGVERGEVRPGAMTEPAFDVIFAMMMYRTKVCGSEWDDAEIEALIDQGAVPFFRSGSH